MKKVICLTLLFGFLLVSRPTYDYANTVEGVIFRVNDANDEVVSIEYLPSFETSQNIVNNAEAKPRNVWRELSPLHSTRSDVERLFGVPETSIAWAHFYKFEKEAVNFRYAKGNCNLSDFGWNVPMDTILEIDVTPLVTLLLSDLDLDLPNFERVESWHPENLFYYTNLEDGVTIQTRLLDGRERVDRIKYGPSTKDLGLACPPATVAFAKRVQEKSALQAMVDTERAFAKLSEDQGTRQAFVSFIADDGILFRPRAVNGKQWFAEHPLPQSDKSPLLSWYPAVAGMSRAGDLGYTTGPWEFKPDIHDAKPVAWGHFLTVWKRQPDGSWKFAIDLGISNPQPEQTEAPWELPQGYKIPKPMKGSGTSSNTLLLARDREFSQAATKRGARAAFADYAMPEVRIYRDGKFPLIGKDLAPGVLPDSSSVWTWEPAAGDVSASDDLGYTYGSYQISGDELGAKVIESGNYFRIWKKDKGGWKVLFDLTNPVPPETNKN